MSIKSAVTGVLLVFVAASMTLLAVKSFRSHPQSAAAETGRDRVIVYYFHTKARCPACANIEAYAHEALTRGFAAQVEQGRIEWNVVDFEEAENEHFAGEYDLIASSVVLVEIRDGVRSKWRNLEEVWDLVDDKPAFVSYVQKEIVAFLDESK